MLSPWSADEAFQRLCVSLCPELSRDTAEPPTPGKWDLNQLLAQCDVKYLINKLLAIIFCC